ncbi:hypothetical protein PALB_21230 [Pseudoalteromonas luteoviolacea B = ATCC 29581]|nr:hypothetical protein PALB_21230 [Pseudoalteromonas luteoviolacea B = ATCC 29581]
MSCDAIEMIHFSAYLLYSQLKQEGLITITKRKASFRWPK